MRRYLFRNFCAWPAVSPRAQLPRNTQGYTTPHESQYYLARHEPTREDELRSTALTFFLVSLGFSGTAFGQKRPSTPAPTFADLGATINAWIDLLPMIDGYKAGVITIPSGSYTQSTTIHVNSPRVSIIGAGSGAVKITCTINSVCWDIRLVPFPFETNPQSGQVSGFTLIGQPANASAVGMEMGDITGARLEDVVIQGFTGSNAVGLWWNNINGWMERVNVQRVWLNGNTTNYKFTNGGGTTLSASFCYNQWLDLRLNVYDGQKGIDFQGGFLCGSTLLVVMNGKGVNKTYINITGNSQWHDNLYNINIEDDGGGGVRLATAPGTEFSGTGLITSVVGKMTDSIGGSFAIYLPFINGAVYSDATTSTAQWYIDQFGNLQVEAKLPATVSNNFNSPFIDLKSSCWNGNATAVDEWRVQNVLGLGANPGSTLQFAFTPTGCSAIPEFQVADGVGNGVLLTTSAPGVSPRIRHDAEDNFVIDTGGANASLYLNTDNNKPVKLGTGGTTGANIPIVASLKTTFATVTNVSMPGVTSSSHCSLTATDAIAGANIGSTFIAAKAEDQITVAHAPVADMTYDVLCTPN
jgi:hypothetical protein